MKFTNLEGIVDFINQTYLNDKKQENKPTAEADQGAIENSNEKNRDIPTNIKRGKQKEVKIDKDGFVIVSKRGKIPLDKRNFKSKSEPLKEK